MILDEAEALVADAKEKIDEFAALSKNGDETNVDFALELNLKESKFLQKTMRRMQEVINQIFLKHDPGRSPIKSYPKTEGQKTPPEDAQLRYRSEEVKNAQKALQNMILEYEKVQARVETVKGASYISDLHEKLDALN